MAHSLGTGLNIMMRSARMVEVAVFYRLEVRADLHVAKDQGTQHESMCWTQFPEISFCS